MFFMFVLFAAIQGFYNEEPITQLQFKDKSDLVNLRLENVVVNDEGMKMRGSTDRGSLIVFKDKNNDADEWSFEFSFNHLDLKYPESAGIYLWYTDEEIKSGNVAGINGEMKGIMTGLEFLGHGLQIVIGANNKNEKMETLDDLLLHRDTINPRRFKDVNEFRFKVISTNKNYKVEIYENDKLLYDNLRFLETPVLGDRGRNKYFGITTKYRKVSSSKTFLIKNIQAYKRTETDEYDPMKFEAVDFKDEPRLGHEIDHTSNEVQHLISNVEHMMAYLKAVLGKPGGSTVYQSAYDAKFSAFETMGLVKKMRKEIDEVKKGLKESGTQIIGSKIGDLELEMRNLKRVLFDTQNTLSQVNRNMKSNHNSVIVVILMIAVVVFIVFIYTRKASSYGDKKNF